MKPVHHGVDILIRAATKTDLAKILALYVQPDVDDENVLSVARAEELFNQMQKYPDYRLLIAELDGTVVGTFTLLIMTNLAHLGASSGVVEDVVVAREHQSQGIGTRMMQYAMEYCRELGCYKLSLSSNARRKRAHAFYQKLGFQKHGYSFIVRP